MIDRVDEPRALRAACDAARGRGARVGVVLTMGALHEGHAALIREAARRADFVVTTVFVNKAQFGPKEDFAKYPRTLDADVAVADAGGAHALCAPAHEVMYPAGDETRVRVGATAAALCGPHRPGHFEGVATVVAKFFGLIGPCVALFGRKDYQQLRVVTRMTEDLLFPVEVVGVATVREPDGLALSSRNRYLSPDDRRRARAIPEALSLVSRAFDAGERSAAALERLGAAHLRASVDSIDYVTVADPVTVIPRGADPAGARALVATAVRVGGTRLIDNVVLGEERAPIEVDG